MQKVRVFNRRFEVSIDVAPHLKITWRKVIFNDGSFVSLITGRRYGTGVSLRTALRDGQGQVQAASVRRHRAHDQPLRKPATRMHYVANARPRITLQIGRTTFISDKPTDLLITGHMIYGSDGTSFNRKSGQNDPFGARNLNDYGSTTIEQRSFRWLPDNRWFNFRKISGSTLTILPRTDTAPSATTSPAPTRA